ncbi:MAG: phosphoribosylformylglycinamidine cyclo-ligase [Thermoplasmata archaeon]
MKTYSEAGVDIDKKDVFLNSLLASMRFRRKGFKEITNIGHYTSLVDMGQYYLAVNTDGVGTKMIIAEEMKKYLNVGIDAIAMNVNDTICVGAEPFAFVDYLIIRDYDIDKAKQIGMGLNRGARMANVNIVGGETAVMPDMVNYTDLSGTSVGIVKKGKQITGSKIRKGDLIYAIASSGLHSNGFTLVRKLLKEKNISYEMKLKGRKIGDILLTSTYIYVKPVMEIVKNNYAHGLAHITGGGLRNLIRLKKVKFVIDHPLKVPSIFEYIRELGNIDYVEMYQTFNMGMGFMIITNENYIKNVDRIVEKHGFYGETVGYIDSGFGVELPEYNIRYEKY